MNTLHNKAIFPVILIAFLLLVAGCTRTERAKYAIVFNTDLSGPITKSDETKWRKTISTAIDSISGYFGFEYKDTLRVYVVEKRYGNAFYGRLYMTPEEFNNPADVIMQVTEGILAPRSSIVHNKGLTIIMVKTFADTANHTYGSEQSVVDYISKLVGFSYLLTLTSEPEGELSTPAYVVRAQIFSFYLFLERTYIRENFRTLYHSASMDYKHGFGKDLAELEQDWKEYLLGLRN